MFIYIASLRAGKIINYTITALFFGLLLAPIPIYFISTFPKINISYLSCSNWFPELSCASSPNLQLLIYCGVVAFLILTMIGLLMNIDSYMYIVRDILPLIGVVPYIIFSVTIFISLHADGFTIDKLGGDNAGYFTRAFSFSSTAVFLVDGIFMCRVVIRKLFFKK